MDPYTVGGMIFSIIVIAMIGGFIVLFPLTRQLGKFIQNKLEEGGGTSPREREELLRLVPEARTEGVATALSRTFSRSSGKP